MRVLVTGAAGSIGRVVAAGLTAAGHAVRGLDLVEADARGCPLGVLVGDCTQPATVNPAVDGVDAVVHLAGRPDESALADELTSHVTTTATILDAMVEHGVSRIVYASSNHAVGMHERAPLLGTDVRPRPDTFYGVAKVAAEALLSLYADRHGIEAVCLRIGSFLERPTSVRGLSTWLSHEDCVRLVRAACTSPTAAAGGSFAVVYGISANTRGWWDLAPGRALGYQPLDDAEVHAGDIASRPDDEVEGARVGGPMAAPDGNRASR